MEPERHLSRWSITSGSLPGGLTLDSTPGTITGTPTTIGNVSFTVQVTDAKSLTGTRSLSINIRGAVSITPATLPGGTVGVPYTATLTATGGVLPYTWSVNTGALPFGLLLTGNADSTATISGTPTTPGTSTFTIQVADAETPPATANSGSLSISIEGLITITNTSLPDGNVGIFYDSQLMATGGIAPYTWSLSATSGPLPPGLTLTAGTGVISGTPTTTGSYPISVASGRLGTYSRHRDCGLHHHHQPDAAAPGHHQFGARGYARRPLLKYIGRHRRSSAVLVEP